MTKGKWPMLKCIALSTKIFCITNVLAGSSINNTAAGDYKRRLAGSRMPAERSESNFISLVQCFSS
jgi:hypothetical protein